MSSRCVESEAPSGKRQANGKIARERKKRKWEEKQEQKLRQKEEENTRREWFENNSNICGYLPALDNDNKAIAHLLDPFRQLKHHQENSDKKLFIVEGAEAVRLLIGQHLSREREKLGLSVIKIHSVLIKPSTFFDEPVCLLRDVKEMNLNNANNDEPQKVYVAPESVLTQLAGFPIQRGALACGVIPQDVDDETWLHSFIDSRQRNDNSKTDPIRLLACDGICDTANLGSIIRSAAAFGIDAIILSHDSCNAWYRRSVRVSMGYIVSVPIIRVPCLRDTLQRLAQSGNNIGSYAAVIDTDAEMVLEELESFDESWCCVVGNEGNGISESVVEACKSRVRIGMVGGVDSLSVPVATGILLHGLKRLSQHSKPTPTTSNIADQRRIRSMNHQSC